MNIIIINNKQFKVLSICYTLLNSKTTLMYIDHLKKGAGGYLSHD